jgi:muramidase (phage lysozyme)
MAENNFDPELEQELERVVRELQKLNGSVSTTKKDTSILDRAESAENKKSQEKIQAKRLQRQALSLVNNGLLNLGTSLSGSGSSFRPVTAAIKTLGRALNKFASGFGAIGKLIGGVLEGVADGVNHVVETFEKIYGNFERLSDAGLVDRVETLRDISVNTKLKTETLESVLVKNSKNLATFAGGSLKGAQEFKKLASVNLHNRERFFKMGFSVEEYAESQAEYLGTMGLLMSEEQREFKTASMNFPGYLENLVKLSNMTGKTRSELRNQLNDLTMDQRFRAWSSGREEKQVERANNLIAVMGTIGGPEVGKAITDTISANGAFALNSDNFKKLYMTYKMGDANLIESIQRVMSGVMSVEDFVEENKKVMKNAGDRLQSTVKEMGDVSFTIKYANIRNQEAFQLNRILKDIGLSDKERLKLEERDEKDKNLARTRIQMSDTSTGIQQLSTSSDLVISGFHKMTEGIDTVVDLAYQFAGKDAPDDVKNLRKQNKLIRDVTKLERESDKLEKRQQEILTEIGKIERNEVEGIQDSTSKNVTIQVFKQEYEKNKGKKTELTKKITNLNLEINKIKNEISSAGGTIVTGTVTTSGGGTTTTTTAGSTTGAASGATTGAASGATTGATAPTSQAPGTVSSSTTPGVSEREQQPGQPNQGLAAVRELIASVESVGGSYNSVFGGGTNTPLTTMTIAEVMKFQQDMLRRGAKSTAIGKYQFMSYTLPEYVKKAGLDPNNTRFDSVTQDLLADILIRERGYDSYKSGKISAEQFLENLSRAWAGLPSPSKGGRSYYAKDGLNRSNVDLNGALARIRQARTGGIFRGPSTGYLAELHGDEIVIPANDTITKQNLQNTVLPSESDDEMMLQLFTLLDARVEDMIDLISDSNSMKRMYSKF